MRYALWMLLLLSVPWAGHARLQVVATLTNYAWVASEIGGDLVQASAIALPDQDPHYVRPKPSFALQMKKADLFVTTGLDLEMWSPALLDKAGNSKIMEGSPGYCAVSAGIPLLEVPKTISRAVGDVHIYGNPHFCNSPLHMKMLAVNIFEALVRVDPAHREAYERNYAAFMDKMNASLYGADLLKEVEFQTLDAWLLEGTFWEKVKEKSLEEKVGGWLKRALPLRGRNFVNYHKNWAYFAHVFDIHIVDFVEPKPGIPPSPRDVNRFIGIVKDTDVVLLFDTPYYREDQLRRISDATGIPYAILPSSVGDMGTGSFYEVMDLALDKLLAGGEQGRISRGQQHRHRGNRK
jgi:zinc/manganese transport system substrate-binding protein